MDEDKDVITPKEAFRSTEFWILTILLFQGLFYGLYVASVFKFAAQSTITSDTAITAAGAVGSMCNGGSRVFWAGL